MCGLRDPKILGHGSPDDPHDPVVAVDDERQPIPLLAGDFPIDEQVLQLLPAAAHPIGRNRSPRLPATGRRAGAPRPAGLTATVRLPGCVPERCWPVAISADTAQPCDSSRTSPGIDSGNRKEFAKGAANVLRKHDPLADPPCLLPRQAHAPRVRSACASTSSRSTWSNPR